MSTAEQIIAPHLNFEYSIDTEEFYCLAPGCTATFEDEADHAAHVVAALTNAGYALVGRDVIYQASSALEAGAVVVNNHGKMLAQLVMDTPKDQELTDRLVELARNSAQNLRTAAARVAEGGDQP
ncbi:hypothetical protein [Prescottella equi]|uniref:hypothetical protein n=1 Tax=Rhodococcus hoagii TaxID=43767 RepID=UPI0007CD77E5|nr:hypothetical protein [Prescottella equi]